LKEKVTFVNFKEDVYKILKLFDVFVLSSVTEGISLTLLEAMASGLPVVVTNVGGNPEVVVDGETGFLVPPKNPEKMAEAIITLLKNKELAKKMGVAGRKRVEEKFSLERMVREYEEIYRNLLKYDRNT
ncbi:glycosyltransferase, partial [Candidatus Bathyarchaeota archaeon]